MTGMRLTCRVAYPSGISTRAAWFPPIVTADLFSSRPELPQEVFTRLEKFKNTGPLQDRVRWYGTRVEADAALSLAAVNYARSLSGHGALKDHACITAPVSSINRAAADTAPRNESFA